MLVTAIQVGHNILVTSQFFSSQGVASKAFWSGCHKVEDECLMSQSTASHATIAQALCSAISISVQTGTQFHGLHLLQKQKHSQTLRRCSDCSTARFPPCNCRAGSALEERHAPKALLFTQVVQRPCTGWQTTKAAALIQSSKNVIDVHITSCSCSQGILKSDVMFCKFQRTGSSCIQDLPKTQLFKTLLKI